MQTEHLKYVDLVDLHHRFLVQISRQIARGFAWWLISLTNLDQLQGTSFNDACSLGELVDRIQTVESFQISVTFVPIYITVVFLTNT